MELKFKSIAFVGWAAPTDLAQVVGATHPTGYRSALSAFGQGDSRNTEHQIRRSRNILDPSSHLRKPWIGSSDDVWRLKISSSNVEMTNCIAWISVDA
jgi:hypothetical protein